MKRRILSLVFVIIMIFSVSVFGESPNTVKVPALMYHSVSEGNTNAIISPENFRKHLETIRDNGFTPVSLDELIAYVDFGTPLPEKPVLITFDDGYLNNYTEAFPIIQEFGFKATIFAIVSSVGKDTYKGTTHKMNSHFSYEQAREMIASGLVSVQSHTYDMHQWAAFEGSVKQPRETVLRLENESLLDYITHFEGDFLAGKTLIEDELEQSLLGFAYPLGKYNAITDFILKKNGVRVTVATTTGQNYVKKLDTNSLYNLNRHNIYDGISTKQLLNWLNED